MGPVGWWDFASDASQMRWTEAGAKKHMTQVNRHRHVHLIFFMFLQLAMSRTRITTKRISLCLGITAERGCRRPRKWQVSKSPRMYRSMLKGVGFEWTSQSNHHSQSSHPISHLIIKPPIRQDMSTQVVDLTGEVADSSQSFDLSAGLPLKKHAKQQEEKQENNQWWLITWF